MENYGKYKDLKTSLIKIDDHKFDVTTVQEQYIENVGTIYDQQTSGLQFHLFGIDIIFDDKLNPYVLEIF